MLLTEYSQYTVLTYHRNQPGNLSIAYVELQEGQSFYAVNDGDGGSVELEDEITTHGIALNIHSIIISGRRQFIRYASDDLPRLETVLETGFTTIDPALGESISIPGMKCITALEDSIHCCITIEDADTYDYTVRQYTLDDGETIVIDNIGVESYLWVVSGALSDNKKEHQFTEPLTVQASEPTTVFIACRLGTYE